MYISVSVNGSANSASYYDDTLVLTLPASGTATLEVKLNNETPVTKTYNNENTLRPVTQYISISDLVGRTVQPGSDNVTIEMFGQSDGTTLYYAGAEINAIDEASNPTKTISASNWQSIPNDTIYIEDAGRMLQQDYYVVTKSYVIGVEVASNNFVYYRFNKTYWVTSAFSFFDDGLGINTIKQINHQDCVNSENRNYAVPIGVWADGMTLYQAKTGSESTSFEQDATENALEEYDSWGEAEKKKIYFKVSFGDGEISTAYFGEDGTTLYTGAGYKPNNQEYIMVNVYCKASGGPTGLYSESERGWDKLLGQFRLILI